MLKEIYNKLGGPEKKQAALDKLDQILEEKKLKPGLIVVQEIWHEEYPNLFAIVDLNGLLPRDVEKISQNLEGVIVTSGNLALIKDWPIAIGYGNDASHFFKSKNSSNPNNARIYFEDVEEGFSFHKPNKQGSE